MLFNKCYDVVFRDKFYDAILVSDELETQRKQDDLKSKAIQTPAKSLVRYSRRLKNRIIMFSYNLKKLPVSAASMIELVGSVNCEPLTIGGSPVHNKCQCRIEDLQTIFVDKYAEVYYRIDMSIEIAEEKAVEYTDIPLLDVYFIHPTTHKRLPIQFTNNPQDFIGKSPNTIHIGNGYGFYSIDRQDLNLNEEIPINLDGNINLSGEVFYNRVYEARVANWSRLNIP